MPARNIRDMEMTNLRKMIRRDSPRRDSHPVARYGVTGFELEAHALQSGAYSERLTRRLTELKRDRRCRLAAGRYSAWRDLPANLKAAIVAIVGSD